MKYPEKLLLSLVKNSKSEGIFPIILVMLKSGVNPNILDTNLGDISLLMLSIAVGNSELTELLIQYGADINHEHKVLSRCMLDNYLTGFIILLNTPGLSRKSIEFSLFCSLLDSKRLLFTELLLKYKEICWNARTADGRSPMEFACKVKNVGALQLLEKVFIIYPDN
jgi:ankyrin repeat protein